MTIPIQTSRLQSAIQSGLPDVGQFMQRDAAQCGAMRRADNQNGGTKPPADARPKRSVLSPRQLMAISLLLAGKQVKDVAEELGVNRATVFRWKRDPLFGAEVQRRAELADPVQRRRPRNLFTPGPVEPAVDSDRRERQKSQKSLSELRQSNQRLLEKLVRESSQRH